MSKDFLKFLNSDPFNFPMTFNILEVKMREKEKKRKLAATRILR